MKWCILVPMKGYSDIKDQRESPQKDWILCLIWDLDGNFSEFLRHMKELQLLENADWEWLWWSTTLILSGDILADRELGGFQILREVARLRKEAEKEWGSITILAGNHEEVMIWYFIGYSFNCNSDVKNPLQLSLDHPSFNGIREVLKYGNNYHDVLANMKNDKNGRVVLEEMVKIKLLYKIWDTLHFHTPPWLKMLSIIATEYEKNISWWVLPKDILETTIQSINQAWQKILQKMLFQSQDFTEDGKKEYLQYAGAFLSTANGTAEAIRARWSNPEDYPGAIVPDVHKAYDLFKSSWIQEIFHGHTDTEVRIFWFQVIGINRRNHKKSLTEKFSDAARSKAHLIQTLPDRDTFSDIILENMKKLPDSFSMRKIRIPWHLISYIQWGNISKEHFIHHAESLFPEMNSEWSRQMNFSNTGNEFRVEYKSLLWWKTPIYIENPTSYDTLMGALEKWKVPS